MTWPVTLADGPVALRPLRGRDGRTWKAIRLRNQDWLKEWEATLPPEGRKSGEIPTNFRAMVRKMGREAREGRTLPWAITFEGQLVGQLTVGGITLGSLRACYIGYWIDEGHAGRGITPTAVALACDYCTSELGLHRVEVNIRPENTASRRVVEKLGLREEGLRPQYLHIDGQWRDHIAYSVTHGDYPGGVLEQWRRNRIPSQA